MHLILLIEDNKTIGENIVRYLQTEGYSVDWAVAGDQGIQMATNTIYDCIVLDVMLPGVDGIKVLETIRTIQQTPIIMTTAKGTIDDKHLAYHHGADDYLVKPFALAELVMRIKALIKRVPARDIWQIQDVSIDLEKKTVFRGSAEIHLTMKEFLIMTYLLDQYGNAVSRSDLIEFIWGGDALYEHDTKLDVYIANLRKKLGKSLITTIKGFGYRIG